MADLDPIPDPQPVPGGVRWDLLWCASLVIADDAGVTTVSLVTGPGWPAQSLVVRSVTPDQLRALAATLNVIADRAGS